jgi:hypothetical protein
MRRVWTASEQPARARRERLAGRRQGLARLPFATRCRTRPGIWGMGKMNMYKRNGNTHTYFTPHTHPHLDEILAVALLLLVQVPVRDFPRVQNLHSAEGVWGGGGRVVLRQQLRELVPLPGEVPAMAGEPVAERDRE